MLRRLIEINQRASRRFDAWLPRKYSVDGNLDFLLTILPKYLKHGMRVVDVGGGRHPCIDVAKKKELALEVIGVDIAATELAAAAEGTYDYTVVSDIADLVSDMKADLVICQSILEHVENIGGAFRAVSSMLKPGGKALIFVPSRNSIFARINLILPQKVKTWLLFTLYPQARDGQGFRSFYKNCTPRDFAELAASQNLIIRERYHYWCSEYFSFCFPLHMLWRIWLLAFAAIRGVNAAETFSMVLERRTS
jgi:SAM-dependent methyltransferase